MPDCPTLAVPTLLFLRLALVSTALPCESVELLNMPVWGLSKNF